MVSNSPTALFPKTYKGCSIGISVNTLIDTSIDISKAL